jgi:hypothetical protein
MNYPRQYDNFMIFEDHQHQYPLETTTSAGSGKQQQLYYESPEHKPVQLTISEPLNHIGFFVDQQHHVN